MPTDSMTSVLKTTLKLSVFYCLLFFSCLGCEKEKPAPPPPPPPPSVVVSPAITKSFPIEGSYLGITEASMEVEVRARVNGFVEQQFFVEGSAVQKGDRLYKIDDQTYKARFKRLKAALSNQVSMLNKANRDIDRLKPLYEQDAVSQLDYDNALSAQEQAKASVAASRAELEEAQFDLDQTLILAPIDGMVGESSVDLGALVGSAGQSLLTTVRRLNPIFVKFNMSALDYLNAQRRLKTFLEKIKAEEAGQAIEGFIRITLPDDSEYEHLGDVSFTEPSVNPNTGTFAVRAVLSNPKKELLPGQHTRVRIRLDKLPDSVVVPEETIQIEQGGAYVMVVLPEDVVEQRFVITGPRIGGEVVINSGLSVGERVIVEGMHRVFHGQKANPLTSEEYEAKKAKQKEKELKEGIEGGAS